MRTFLVGIATVAVLGSGCGGVADGETRASGEGSGGSEEAATGPPTACLDVSGEPVVEVRSVHNDFTPECLILSEDQRIRVVNEDLVRHSFTVAEDSVYHTPFLLDIDEIEGGKKVTTEAAGSFLDAEGGNPYFCKYHAGMEGELWLTA
jgi:plastocyanin